MKLIVMDSEGDGLAYDCTKLHNLCSTQDGKEFFYTTDYEEMKKELLSADLIVCHNAIRHDLVVFRRILGIGIPYTKFVDTLALSWHLYPDREKHGLESWGKTVGVSKVYVGADQWSTGDSELMRKRVEEDVKINWLVWKLMEKRLMEIYQ